jgi:hypothetical protein
MSDKKGLVGGSTFGPGTNATIAYAMTVETFAEKLKANRLSHFSEMKAVLTVFD